MQVPRLPQVIFFSFCLFGDVAFSEYFFCTISAFFLYVEYDVRSFLPNDVFLPCDHGLDVLHQSAYYVRIQSINQLNYRAGAFNMPTSYQQWMWEREAYIDWSKVTCQGSTRSELP